MPKASRSAEPQATLASTDENIALPRLVKLIIKNYRCIGSKPIEIDLDEIVVLVGQNNVGKSSILKAYELAMSQGSKNADLTLDDFPNGAVDEQNLPEIEIWTVVYDNTVGDKWIEDSSGECIVKERWIWNEPGAPIRQGWDNDANGWSNHVPWGAPNVANSRRPEPHRVNAFDSPDKQAEVIQKLLMSILNDRVKNIEQDETHGEQYRALLDNIGELQRNIVNASQEEIDSINSELSSLIADVFPGYRIDFDAHPEDDIRKSVSFFKADAKLLMGPDGPDSYMSPIEKQGSGARRALLWTTLRFIKERERRDSSTNNGRPHLLLIDEPEICLHPNATRNAANTLYSLAESENWQVMITTHSPIFIDFSRDNTTVIRVSKDGCDIKATTVFKPSSAELDDDDKGNLKLLNICDPYVAEFLFGGNIVVVEGDTEYTAFSYIKKQYPDEYQDVHIIRARGKATIYSLAKILNKYGARYSILHDSDRPTRSDGGVNSAWTVNNNILSVISKHPDSTQTRLLASIPDFETAYLGVERTAEKPYFALRDIESDETKRSTVKQLLDRLIDFGVDLPTNCAAWANIEDLQNELNNKEERDATVQRA